MNQEESIFLSINARQNHCYLVVFNENDVIKKIHNKLGIPVQHIDFGYLSIWHRRPDKINQKFFKAKFKGDKNVDFG